MPDGNPIASLYPQPAQQRQNMLAGNPLGMIGALNQVNALRQFQGTVAAGRAAQGALNPDGTLNFDRYSSGLQDPSVAPVAQQAIGTLQEQRGRQIENDTRAFGLSSSQNTTAMGILGGLASKDNVSFDDVLGILPTLARAGIPPAQINSWRASLSHDPKVLKGQLNDLANTIMGPAAAAGRVEGPIKPDGTTTTIPLGQANLGAQYATGLPSGQKEALAANEGAYQADQQMAAAKLAAVRPLQTALPLIGKLSNVSFGPGSEGFAKAKSALITAGVIPPNTTDVDVRMEANKYLRAYAGRDRGAERSDQGLNQALASNPNLDLTQSANLALIKNQMALDRQDAAITQGYDVQNPGAKTHQDYLSFKKNYYQNHDQRAFIYDQMSPEERHSTLESLGVKFDANGNPIKPTKPSAAYLKFTKSYDLAKKALAYTPDNQQGQ